jgi:hypothetical protein
MFNKTRTCEETFGEGQQEDRQKIEVTLARLQMMKKRISELRLQCEELRKTRSEHKYNGPTCAECGEPIELGQEVEIRDSAGTLVRTYHKECFRILLQ